MKYLFQFFQAVRCSLINRIVDPITKEGRRSKIPTNVRFCIGIILIKVIFGRVGSKPALTSRWYSFRQRIAIILQMAKAIHLTHVRTSNDGLTPTSFPWAITWRLLFSRTPSKEYRYSGNEGQGKRSSKPPHEKTPQDAPLPGHRC